MNIWRDYKKLPLPEVLSFVVDNRGKTVPTDDNGNHILIATNCIRNENLYPTYEKIRRLSEETYRTWFRAHPIPGDIIFVCKGTPGRTCMVPEPIDFCIAQDMVALRTNDKVVYNRYLLAVLRSRKIQEQIKNTSVGDVIPHFKKQFFDQLLIPVPPMDVQRKIGDFYYSFALKEQINKEINKNLEQQAQALFKSWFIDYDPWESVAPNSWINGKLGDFTEIKRGGSPRPIQEYLSESGLRWLKISDVTSLQTPFVIDIKDHIIEAGLKKTVFLKAGSLVLSNSATPGVPKILDVDTCIHDGWLYFPKSKFSNEYLYLYFKYIRQQLVNLSNGSVFNNLKTDILKEYPTILPDEETLHRFDSIVKPMFLQMQNLTRESHRLVDTRDAILPQLMSGELDVSALDL